MCRELGNGRSGTVYLAYHVELEEYRAVKIVPKSLADYDTFRKEALFLKTLRHPGIPIVYDVEEDTGYSYLIEEYLEGESLYALVKRLGSLSVKAAADLGIQICRIIQFMNSAENPILYLDLQPKNLLVCNGVLRLTDFDHAQYASDAAAFGERYGTIGFAAPEQYTGEPLDCRTDVYAIGALLYFMSRGDAPGSVPEYRNEPEYRMFDRIIRGCMEKEKEARYQSADELQETLQELQNQLKEQAAESRIVVFAGAAAGIGTTHAALGMSHFLTRNGCPALYQEAYDTSAGSHTCEKYGNQNGPDRRISNRMRKHPALLWRGCEAAISLFSSNHKGCGSDPPGRETSGSRFLCSCMRGKMVGDRQDCECGEDLKKPWECDPALQSYGEKSTSETSKSFI